MINLGDKKWGVKDSGLLAYKQVGSKFFNKAFDFARGSRGTYVGRDGLIKNSGEQPTNLVQNGDFSQLGSELVVNGDFATDSNWTKAAGATISNGRGNIIGDGTSFTYLSQPNVFIVGKFYKITLDAVINSGLGLKVQDGTTNENFGAITTSGTYTFYGKANNSILTIGRRTGGIAFDSYIDNVSVKRLDPNNEWTLGAGWSIGDGVAVKASGTSSILFQSNIVESSKLYKLTFDVIRNSGFITSVFLGGVSDSTDIDESGSYTYYITSINQDVLGFNADSTFNGSISNISVQEIDTNTPRIDFTDDVNGHLLLEPQRTNLVLNSEPNSIEVVDSNITYESFSWANGFTNCVRYLDNSVNRLRRVATALASTEYTFSFYIIMDDLSEPNIGTSAIIGDFYLYLGGGIVSSNFTSNNVGNNIWRVSGTRVSGTSALTYNGIYKGTGNSSKGFRVVGWQIEQGSYATSYIPTYGSAQTRLGETCNNSGSAQDFNSEEGVLYAEISGFENDLSNRRISLSDGTANNSIRIFYYNDGGTVFFRKYVGGVQTSIVTINSINQHEITKIAIKYNSTNFDIFANGVKISTNLDSNSFPTNTLNKIGFADGSGSGTPFYGKARSVKYFPTALGDSKLITLTGGDGSLYGLFNSFKARVLADGGTIESQDCIINELKELL